MNALIIVSFTACLYSGRDRRSRGRVAVPVVRVAVPVARVAVPVARVAVRVARVVGAGTSNVDVDVDVDVCVPQTSQLSSFRKVRGASSLTSRPRIAAVISALVSGQLSAAQRRHALYESVFESYIFSGGASSSAAELAKPPMPVTA